MFKPLRRPIRKMFKQLDLFGQPVLLSYKQSTRYKTTFGGILTMILIFCVVAMSIESIRTLLFREKIYTSSSVLSNLNPIEHKIDLRDGYYFAVGFNPEIYNNWTSRIFTFLVQQRSFKRYSNGTRYLAKESLVELEACSQAHFPADYDYVKYGQKNWMCPPRNITLNLKGQYESDEFNYLRISVMRCKNNTQNNYTCMSPEDIASAKAKLVGDDGKIYLKMVISNNLFNMENFNQPIVHYLDSSGFFLIDPNASFRSVDVFVKHNTVQSDYNLIFSDTTEKIIPSFLNYREQVTAPTGDTFATIYFRCALERGLHRGTTEKFTIILANFGGLVSTVYALLVIMAQFINRKRMLISISNFLYNFEFSSGEKKFESPLSEIEIEEVKNNVANFPSTFRAAEDGESRRKYDGSENPAENHVSIKDGAPEAKKVYNEGEVKFISRVAAYLQHFTKMKMSVLTIINLFLCRRKGKKKVNEKLQLSRKAFKKVESDMDVMQLIRKVKEIEKLKDFLFDEHQKVIFEFFPREVIKSKPPKLKKKTRTSLRTFAINAKKKSSTVKRKLYSDFLKKLAERRSEAFVDDPNKIYTELFSAYQYLTQSEGHPRKEDTKLITLLGKEILKIIKSESEHV